MSTYRALEHSLPPQKNICIQYIPGLWSADHGCWTRGEHVVADTLEPVPRSQLISGPGQLIPAPGQVLLQQSQTLQLSLQLKIGLGT